MAWSDEPTDAQINAIFMLIRWAVPTPTAQRATTWLRYHGTRREVSNELKRLRGLYIEHGLSASDCFNSEIWEGFEYE